jgi:hypothetical protein
MRRISVLHSVPAVALVGLLAAGRAPATTTQDATPPAGGAGVVGSWRVVVGGVSGRTYPALITFAADGTMTVSEPPVLPAPPGAPYAQLRFSGGHGAWASSGERAAAITFDLLAADETGNPLGAFTVRGTVEVDMDGRRWDGGWDAVVTDPAGNVGPAFAGTFSGTRITVEPPGTPPPTGAGTPMP